MDYQPFEIMLISADQLKNVNFFSRMRVYVAVSIVGHSSSVQETPISKHHGTDPIWGFRMRFYVEESKLHQNHLMLVLKLRCSRILGGDEDVGEVRVPLKKLFDDAGESKYIPAVTYQVVTPSGKSRGFLCFSYSFGKTISVGTASKRVDEAVTPNTMPLAPCPSPSAPYLPPEGYCYFSPGYDYI